MCLSLQVLLLALCLGTCVMVVEWQQGCVAEDNCNTSVGLKHFFFIKEELCILGHTDLVLVVELLQIEPQETPNL